jgi:site-specific recombinase XerC
LEVVLVKTVMPAVARGPLAGNVMEELSAWLGAEGYSSTMVPQVLGVARGLSAWMDDHDIGLQELGLRELKALEAAYGPGVAGHVIVRMRVPVVRRFLVETGRLPGALPTGKRTRRPGAGASIQVSAVTRGELEEWARWQREARGISEGCIRHRASWAASFVESLVHDDAVDWSGCDIAVLNAFVTQRSAGLSAASRTLVVDATRSLMRWALSAGRVDLDLTGGILRTRSTRATLPRGLAPAQLQQLLAACSPATIVGVRDRAVLTCLSRLGLRAGEAAGLSLEDIDWAAGRLSVIGKGPRRLTLPIPADVGQALVEWLRVRPDPGAPVRAVFVRLRPPEGPLSSAGISDIVKHRAEAAGLGVMHAHRLRHTAAMNVIAAGGTLVEAQELLGHQSAASTGVYARTDLASLRTLTVPFGQVP